MSDLSRYHRQMLLPDIGETGQRRLLASCAVIVGCGALGTVAAELLARAGVGHLKLVDRDIVELTNLQRQTLFDESDARAGVAKAEAAARRLARINSTISIDPVVRDVNPGTVTDILFTSPDRQRGENIDQPVAHAPGSSSWNRERQGGEGIDQPVAHAPGSSSWNPERQRGENIDQPVAHAPGSSTWNPDRKGGGDLVILDCTDNFETRYLLNDACVSASVRLVYAGAVGMNAVQMTINPGVTPCVRCVFEEPPSPGSTPTCDTAGVLGPLTAMIASMQAAEAIKLLVGRHDLSSRYLTSIDLRTSDIRQLDLSHARRADCPCCGLREFGFLRGERVSAASVLCGRGAVQVLPSTANLTIALPDLETRLRAHGDVSRTSTLLRATLDHEPSENGQPVELTVFPDGRAIIRGSAGPEAARAIYARYVGA